MVSYKEVRAANALINDTTAPRVAVFAGGTSGIGKFTIRELVATGTSVKVYVVGRKSAQERTGVFIQEMSAINPKAQVIWTEGEISLLADVKRVCDDIKSKESRVDLLFLSAGYAPFGGREETAEGVELVQCLEYYSRMAFTVHLLPLLRKAEAPKVVSVLAGGLEPSSIRVDDLDLKKPGAFSATSGQIHFAAMNTLFLEKLAGENPDVTFVHSWPGIVSTGNIWRTVSRNSLMGWVIWLIVEPLMGLFGFSDQESGQRHLFESTSAYYGGRGTPWKGSPGVNSLGKQEDGLFVVNYKCKCTPNAKAMSRLRQQAQDKVWEHTKEVFRPYL